MNQPWRYLQSAILFALLSGTFGCAPDSASPAAVTASRQSQIEVRIGERDFREQKILSRILLYYAQDAGARAFIEGPFYNPEVAWEALTPSDGAAPTIDVMVTYTGTIMTWIEPFQSAAEAGELTPHADAATQIRQIENFIRDKKLDVAITPLGFENNFTVGMLADIADEKSIETIADLAEHPDLKPGFTDVFERRYDKLRERFQLPQADPIYYYDYKKRYEALLNGEIHFTDPFTTDPWYDNIAILQDDQKEPFLLDYPAVLMYRPSRLAPSVRASFDNLRGAITDRAMREMTTKLKAAIDEETASGNANPSDETAIASLIAAEFAKERLDGSSRPLLPYVAFAAILAAVIVTVHRARRTNRNASQDNAWPSDNPVSLRRANK